jgi:hypothetical protein
VGTFGTGAAPQRAARSSQLVFGWESRHQTLDAYTGQEGFHQFFINPGAVPALVTGRNGTPVQAGYAMPRWEQVAARGNIPRLVIEGEVGGQVVENVVYQWPLKVMAQSVFFRLWPFYNPGESLGSDAYALCFGVQDTDGGYLRIYRHLDRWYAHRARLSVGWISEFVEPGTTVFPIDILVTLSAAGTLQIQGRDSSPSRTRTVGAPLTNASMVFPEPWDDNVMTLCGSMGLVAPGGRWRYESIKVARGVHTFDSIDKLT